MSELIQKHDNRATIRWKLLTGASALALAAYVSSATIARAEDADRPLLWINLGTSLDLLGGLNERFDAHFMHLTPTPSPYKGGSPFDLQRPMRFSIDGNLGLTFQPKDSDWVFSAGIRYGRSHKKLDRHHQTKVVYSYPAPYLSYYTHYKPSWPYPATRVHTERADKMVNTNIGHSEHHMVLDFQAGKDFGLGMFGHDGTSVLSGGVRVADFSEHNGVNVRARPNLTPFARNVFGHIYPYYNFKFPSYYLVGESTRDFHGVGPALSWSASVPVAGQVSDGQLSLDFGLNGAVLFGRQKAKVSHHTTGYYVSFKNGKYHFNTPTKLTPPPQSRARKVTVPNVGATFGLSYRYSNAKISIGYRYDTFLDAMDTGIDARKTSNVTFNGPYASISIGLGD
jgi:hypothetical protein